MVAKLHWYLTDNLIDNKTNWILSKGCQVNYFEIFGQFFSQIPNFPNSQNLARLITRIARNWQDSIFFTENEYIF